MFYSQRSMLIFHPNFFILFVFFFPLLQDLKQCSDTPKNTFNNRFSIYLFVLFSKKFLIFPKESWSHNLLHCIMKLNCQITSLLNNMIYLLQWSKLSTTFIFDKLSLFLWFDLNFIIPISWISLRPVCHSSF